MWPRNVHNGKSSEDMDNYETLSKSYELDKQTFEEQYIKVENIINSKQK